MAAFLYVRQGCEDCETARSLLAAYELDYREVEVDNPLVEAAINQIFGAVRTPVLVIDGDGVYALDAISEQGETFVKRLDLTAEKAAA